MVYVDVSWSDEFRSEFTEPVKNSIIVIVDTFRSTSVIPFALSHGASKVVVAKDADSARLLKKNNSELILAGEKEGVMIPGFDIGNSPHALENLLKDSPDIAGEIVLNTSNLSKVLEDVMLLSDGSVVIASPLNRSAVIDYLREKSSSVDSIYFIATGTFHMAGKSYDIPLRTLEDLFGCLTILYGLSNSGVTLDLSERANHYFKEHEDVLIDDSLLLNALWHTHYAKYLLELDEHAGNSVNRDDLEVCIQFDECLVVPLAETADGFIECSTNLK